MADAQFVTERGAAVAPTHKVLRNTYMYRDSGLFTGTLAELLHGNISRNSDGDYGFGFNRYNFPVSVGLHAHITERFLIY